MYTVVSPSAGGVCPVCHGVHHSGEPVQADHHHDDDDDNDYDEEDDDDDEDNDARSGRTR